MEEKKQNKDVKSTVKKLSYEDLENAAKQLSIQLDAVMQENKRCKELLNGMQMQNFFTELEFRFKVIKYADHFPDDFVENCVQGIVYAMTPTEENEKETKPDIQ